MTPDSSQSVAADLTAHYPELACSVSKATAYLKVARGKINGRRFGEKAVRGLVFDDVGNVCLFGGVKSFFGKWEWHDCCHEMVGSCSFHYSLKPRSSVLQLKFEISDDTWASCDVDLFPVTEGSIDFDRLPSFPKSISFMGSEFVARPTRLEVNTASVETGISKSSSDLSEMALVSR